MTLKWNFWRGGGVNLKNLPWEEYGYFLEQRILHYSQFVFGFLVFFLPPDYFPTCQFDEIKSVKTLYVIQNEIE